MELCRQPSSVLAPGDTPLTPPLCCLQTSGDAQASPQRMLSPLPKGHSGWRSRWGMQSWCCCACMGGWGAGLSDEQRSPCFGEQRGMGQRCWGCFAGAGGGAGGFGAGGEELRGSADVLLPAVGRWPGWAQGHAVGTAGQRQSLAQAAWLDSASGGRAGENRGEDWAGESLLILQPQHLVESRAGEGRPRGGCRGKPGAGSRLPGMGWLRPFPVTALTKEPRGLWDLQGAQGSQA